MKKYVVETYYTCTFKTVHTLNNLDDVELSKIDQDYIILTIKKFFRKN